MAAPDPSVKTRDAAAPCPSVLAPGGAAGGRPPPKRFGQGKVRTAPPVRAAPATRTAFSVPGVVSPVLAAANGWLLAMLGGLPSLLAAPLARLRSWLALRVVVFLDQRGPGARATLAKQAQTGRRQTHDADAFRHHCLQQSAIVGVLPDRQSRARRQSRLERLAVGAVLRADPLHEVDDQILDGLALSHRLSELPHRCAASCWITSLTQQNRTVAH